ncbi:hypothetical protein STEG23_036483 [Scotinomys teguina]
MISLTDTQKIGMGLTGFGVFFLFFGMILFFDKALLAIGNVLFVAGLAFVIGLERTFRFFFQKHKVKATGFFLGGVFVVLIGWPLIGMIFEIYGFFLLFRSPQRSHQISSVLKIDKLPRGLFSPCRLTLRVLKPQVAMGLADSQGPSSLAVTVLALLLALSVLGNCSGAPQRLFERRNWTPQAMLYLKGAQRRNPDLQLLTLPEAAVLLASLQKPRKDEGGNFDQSKFLEDRLLNW